MIEKLPFLVDQAICETTDNDPLDGNGITRRRDIQKRAMVGPRNCESRTDFVRILDLIDEFDGKVRKRLSQG